MHLIPCLECGKPINNEVFTCPHCKKPTKTGIENNPEMGNAEFSIQTPLIHCIACKREVEETSVSCPHCGTKSPKRILLAPCRACGEEIGKSASKCPHCQTEAPYRAKNIRRYLLLASFLLLLFSSSDYRDLVSNNSETVENFWNFFSWGNTFFLIWFFYKYMKDLSG